jgi:hypothetical protein
MVSVSRCDGGLLQQSPLLTRTSPQIKAIFDAACQSRVEVASLGRAFKAFGACEPLQENSLSRNRGAAQRVEVFDRAVLDLGRGNFVKVS